MATQTLSNDDIIEAIGNLSVVELAELIEKFKEKFGVTIAAPVAGTPAAGGAKGARPARLSGLLWLTTCADLPHTCSLVRAPRFTPDRRSGRGRRGLLHLPEVTT